MDYRVEEVIREGYTPVIYIDTELFNPRSDEVNAIVKKAKANSIKVLTDRTVEGISARRKHYVWRYGHIPRTVEVRIKKKGTIVPGIF